MQKVSFSSRPKTRVGSLRSMGTSRDIPGSVRKGEIMFMVVLNPKERGKGNSLSNAVSEHENK